MQTDRESPKPSCPTSAGTKSLQHDQRMSGGLWALTQQKTNTECSDETIK